MGSESAARLGAAQVEHEKTRRYMRDTLEDVLEWFESEIGEVNGVRYDEASIVAAIKEALAVASSEASHQRGDTSA